MFNDFSKVWRRITGTGPTQSPVPVTATYFGGKSSVASEVWVRFGDVPNYVEPFAGSLAVLLARPTAPGIETVNDYDGLLSNFWRAVKFAPETVAESADWPVNEADLHARHAWLVRRKPELTDRLMGDPDWYDAKAAGWWVWGCCQWIGGGWCSGEGPWQSVDGKLVKANGDGCNKQLPHLGDAGRGINRKLPHLGNAGRGDGACAERTQALIDTMQALSDRLRNVRVCCGDWSRVCGPTPTEMNGLTAVFLDPPYTAEAGRSGVYAEENLTVGHDVAAWAIANGDNPKLRLAVCGYAGEYQFPESWECFAWKARGGYGSQGKTTGRDNCHRERVWFSPHCIPTTKAHGNLFDE